ncbi:hypothetical protein [Nocardia vaccinii]|uniref:hypothetical protein n=1 Tax=Nocardia vaccinii TaxID=1822 RepID=UPI0012F4F067|nr:hypothetical protein [Nocardia vaccinii]
MSGQLGNLLANKLLMAVVGIFPEPLLTGQLGAKLRRQTCRFRFSLRSESLLHLNTNLLYLGLRKRLNERISKIHAAGRTRHGCRQGLLGTTLRHGNSLIERIERSGILARHTDIFATQQSISNVTDANRPRRASRRLAHTTSGTEADAVLSRSDRMAFASTENSCDTSRDVHGST